MEKPPQYDQQGYGNPVMTQQPQYVPGMGMPQQQSTTTVIINQQPQATTRDWSSGLCACFDDMESCCLTWLCGCCYVGCLYQRFNETWCTVCCVPAADMFLRVQHRNRQKIYGSVMNDCCVASFCGMCAVCQLKRDMDYTERNGMSLNF